jgi:predicted RNA binding protein YcfA (HicA-like mRNA interferase family)
MSKLPRLSGRECVRALEKAGFSVIRRRGSHIVMRRDEPLAQVTVPDHRELHTGTLRDIIRDAGLTVDEFIELL